MAISNLKKKWPLASISTCHHTKRFRKRKIRFYVKMNGRVVISQEENPSAWPFCVDVYTQETMAQS